MLTALSLQVTTRFRLVKKKTRPDGRAPLWLRVKVKGTDQCAEKATGLFLLPSEWDQQTQTLTREVPKAQLSIWARKLREVQAAFDAAELDARADVRSQRASVITPAQVKKLATSPVHGGAVSLTAIAAAEQYIQWRQTQLGQPGHEANTVRSVTTRLRRFIEWVAARYRKGLLAAELTPDHADSFTEWLRLRAKGTRPLAYNSKCLEAARCCLDWHRQKGRLLTNPWADATLSRGTQASLVYLESEELTALENADLSGFAHRLTRARWLFLLSCYTGLAWADLEIFVRAWLGGRGLRTDGNGQRWLEFRRHKTRHEAGAPTVVVPLLPGAEKLLAIPVDLGDQRPGREESALVGYATHRSDLLELGTVVRLPVELTTHVARKTFGMLLLNAGVPLETVSRLMGHKNIRTTQQHYAQVLARRVMVDLGKAGVLCMHSQAK